MVITFKYHKEELYRHTVARFIEKLVTKNIFCPSCSHALPLLIPNELLCLQLVLSLYCTALPISSMHSCYNNYDKSQFAHEKKCTSNERATIGNANASVADGLFSAFFSTILLTKATFKHDHIHSQTGTGIGQLAYRQQRPYVKSLVVDKKG